MFMTQRAHMFMSSDIHSICIHPPRPGRSLSLSGVVVVYVVVYRVSRSVQSAVVRVFPRHEISERRGKKSNYSYSRFNLSLSPDLEPGSQTAGGGRQTVRTVTPCNTTTPPSSLSVFYYALV